MYYYDLFMQGPAVYIPVLLISLAITMLAYGAFPLIFSRVRKKQITKKKFALLCYGVNLLVMIAFIAFGSKSSGAPYMLWTWIFSSAGIRRLEKRGKFGYSFINNDSSNVEITISNDDIVENDDNIIKNDSNVNAGIDVKVVADNDADNLHTDNKDSKEKVLFCKLCGSKIDSETRKCNGCGKQYFRGILKKKKHKVITKYCKKCGSLIDNQSRKCIGCGKQYFKGFRLKTFLCIFLLIFLVAIIITLCVELNDLNWYKERYNDIYDEYSFYHSKAVIVPDDNTKLYHSYDCKDLDISSYWVYNTEAAKGKGFKPCPECRSLEIYYEKKEQKSNNVSEPKTTQKQQSVQPAIQNTKPQQTSKRTCISALCENEVSGTSSYCFEHKCYWPDCNFGRNRGGYYCSTHTCNDVGCNNPVVGNYKSYCQNHTCYYPGCTSGQSFNSVYCLRHK